MLSKPPCLWYFVTAVLEQASTPGVLRNFCWLNKWKNEEVPCSQASYHPVEACQQILAMQNLQLLKYLLIKAFTGHLRCARCCDRNWGWSSELNSLSVTSSGETASEGRDTTSGRGQQVRGRANGRGFLQDRMPAWGSLTQWYLSRAWRKCERGRSR